MFKILIIEDEPSIRQLVLYHLEKYNYCGIEARDGILGLEMAYCQSPDLILLDIMLPGKDGYEICRQLRADGVQTPIIMLTAKNEEIDKVLGLELGADDYIPKPFSVCELMARIKAILRRYEERKGNKLFLIGELSIDIERHEVAKNGKIIYLSLKEFKLLQTLAENRGQVLSREQLLDKVWDSENLGETRTVDVHVRYLRKKLHDESPKENYIQTIRGLGYKIP